jgi:IS30 family transposase
MGIAVHLARPCCSNGRDRKDSTGVLLRHCFSKKSFDKIDPKHLQRVVDKLNNRPGKNLDSCTPAEAFIQSKTALHY